jgi:hypothetical protein
MKIRTAGATDVQSLRLDTQGLGSNCPLVRTSCIGLRSTDAAALRTS